MAGINQTRDHEYTKGKDSVTGQPVPVGVKDDAMQVTAPVSVGNTAEIAAITATLGLNDATRLFYDNTLKVHQMWNGSDLVSLTEEMAVEIQTDGTYTYIAEAPPNSGVYATRTLHLAAAVWRVQRIVTATGSTDWADGNTNFDNVATTLGGLTYDTP